MKSSSTAYALDLTVLIPLLNEAESLPELHERITRAVQPMGVSYEIVMVDDGSRDDSWAVIEALHAGDDHVRGIRFAHNYGKSPALQVGFTASRGCVVVTMDADLQDAPEEIPELYRMITEEGWHLVSGWKQKRYDPLSKTLPTKLFNATVRLFSGVKLHDFNCGLKAYNADVVHAIEVYNDMHRFLPYMAKNEGFDRITEKVVKHSPRKYGSTKFGLNRFVHGYLDLLVLWFMNRFGRKPMHFFGLWGSVMFFVGFLCLAGILVYKFVMLQSGQPARLVTDLPYFYLSLLTIVLGSMLFLTGFMGELIARQSPSRNSYSIIATLDSAPVETKEAE